MVATPTGEVTLYDVAGNSIANASLNSTLGSENFKAGQLPEYEPVEIIKPPNVNELIFGVRSERRIDAFRLITDDSKALNVKLVHVWVSTLKDAGLQGKMFSVASR